jgi:hypothetical protein
VDIVCSFDELLSTEVVSTNSVTTREVESTNSVTTTGPEELDPAMRPSLLFENKNFLDIFKRNPATSCAQQ